MILGILGFALVTAILYVWGLRRSMTQSADLERILLSKSAGKVVHYLKGHDQIDLAQMALEDDRLRRLIAGRCLLHDDDVPGLVLMRFQAPLLRERHAPVADGLGVPGPVGNGAHLLEKPEHTAGFQMLQNAHS